MNIDSNKTLAELSNIDWGETPSTATFILRERYEARRKPLCNLSYEELSMLITINFEEDSAILIPYALDRLKNTANNEDREAVPLLHALLLLKDYKWLENKTYLSSLRNYCYEWLYVYNNDYEEAESRDDSNEFYRLGFILLGKENFLLKNWLELEKSFNDVDSI